MFLSGVLLGEGHMGCIHKKKFLQNTSCITSADGKSACLKLLESDADFAVIATPASTHYFYAKRALENGIPVFIEKPLATSFKEAEELISISEKNRVPLFVAQSERYNPSFEDFKKRTIPILNEAKNPIIEFCRKNKPSLRARDVPSVFDISVHDFDLLFALIGEKAYNYNVVRLDNSFDTLYAELQVDKYRVKFISDRFSANVERKISIDCGLSTICFDFNAPRTNIYDAIDLEHAKFFEIIKDYRTGKSALDGALFAVALAETLNRT